MLFTLATVASFLHGLVLSVASVSITTTSGKLVGVDDGAGVISFKAIPYAQSPTGNLRWEPPVPFLSLNTINATKLGPSCLQQFAFAAQVVTIPLFNTPPPPSESEDCLFLNVWAPSSTSGTPKAVIFWIHGGALAFGSASLAAYDGTSLAKNQNVIVVSINYRINVFGFPFTSSPAEITPGTHNLGLLDQELALLWTRTNIAQFGGDPNRISLVGQSAGASSVTWFLQRHTESRPPFQSAVLLSSAFLGEVTPSTDESAWTAFAGAVGCGGEAVGESRIGCLRGVPAATIHGYFNGPTAPPTFAALIDNVTVFPDPVGRILAGSVAKVPLFQGGMEDDGSLFVFGQTDVGAFLNNTFGPGLITPAEIAPLYPNLTGFAKISKIDRDLAFVCPASLHTGAYVQSGEKNVFRYIYGAAFANEQVLGPSLGAFHGSELPELFGTFNRTTSTPSQITLSSTFQTIVANFVKNPFASPAPNFQAYNPIAATLAKLAFDGNVELGNVVESVNPAVFDTPCVALWDGILLLPPTGAGEV